MNPTSTLTRAEALEVLTTGLERWEEYFNPQGTMALQPDVGLAILIDKCWDINLYMEPSRKLGSLAIYACELTKHSMARNSENGIHIYSHNREGTLYNMVDTVLHELAHHIVYVCFKPEWRNQGSHGARWKWVCRVLGANPSAMAKPITRSN